MRERHRSEQQQQQQQRISLAVVVRVVIITIQLCSICIFGAYYFLLCLQFNQNYSFMHIYDELNSKQKNANGTHSVATLCSVVRTDCDLRGIWHQKCRDCCALTLATKRSIETRRN